MTYSYLKLIHIFAVVLFLGNIITGLFWMRLAVKTRDLKIISFTIKTIIRADKYFTIPGVIVISAGGVFAAIYGHYPMLKTGWIFWSILLFTISGIVFGFLVSPLQNKILGLTSEEEKANFDWNHFNRIYLKWDAWGLVALLTPLIAFILMILKVPQQSF